MQTNNNLGSVSLANISVDQPYGYILANEQAEQGYLTGAMLMLITSFIGSIIHIATKHMYTRSPEITGYDTCFFIGVSIVWWYYPYAKFKGISVCIFDFEYKAQLLLIARVAVGLADNIWVFTALRYISVSKGILIFSLSPLFWTIIAGFLLKERVTIVSIFLALWSVGGVYLLTFN